METHIRILLGAITNVSVPEAPDSYTISMFERRFTSSHDVSHLLNGRIDFQGDHATLQSINELRAQCARDPSSNIVLAISRVPENVLRLIFSTIHSCGLPS